MASIKKKKIEMGKQTQSELYNELFKRTWWGGLHYILYSPVRIFNDVKLEIKHALQRVFREFDDTYYWDLEYHLDKIIPAVLKWQIKYGIGYPTKTPKEWDDIRKKIIGGFEAEVKLRDLDFDLHDKKTIKKLEEQREKGLALFFKNYGSFWD